MTHTSIYETYEVKTNFKQIMSFLKFGLFKNAISSKIRCKYSADSQRKLHMSGSNFRNKFTLMYFINSTVNN